MATNEQRRKAAISAYRQEATRLASKANKRIKRLQKNNLTNSPAYQKYVSEGAERFSIKGKSYNELQAEVARMRGFIESESSTVRGYNKVLKDMAANTGIKYKNLTELREAAPKFFELTSKVEQYLRTVEDMASAIGYQQIWEAVNEYVRENKIDLGDATANIDEMIKRVSDAITNYESPVKIPEGEWYKLNDE